jgi:hypothetical protein
MEAVTNSGKEYPSWDALVDAESNGYVAVAILQENTPKKGLFCWVVGPFPTKREATNAGVRIRAKYKRDLERAGHPLMSTLIRVNIRPAWKDVT